MIRVADNKTPGVRTFYFDSGSRPGVTHTCQYVRRGTRRKWYCTCENFTYEQLVKVRHCWHLKKLVRLAKEYGGVTELVKVIRSGRLPDDDPKPPLRIVDRRDSVAA